MNTNDIELPPEFRSGNSVQVERATVTRERMEEILKAAIEADRTRRGEPDHLISACYFPGHDEVELTWERKSDGAKAALTCKVTPEQGKQIANVVWPCVYLAAAPQLAEPNDTVKDMVEEDNRRAAEQACNVLALRLGYVWNGEDWVIHKTSEPSGASTPHNADSGAQNGNQAPLPADPCDHSYHYFGDHPIRRCNKCKELEQQPAEPVTIPETVASGGDYSEPVGMPISATQSERDAYIKGFCYGRRYALEGRQPAEPVQVPSDGDLLALIREHAFRQYELDDLLSFARALLNKYGAKQ